MGFLEVYVKSTPIAKAGIFFRLTVKSAKEKDLSAIFNIKLESIHFYDDAELVRPQNRSSIAHFRDFF